MRALLPKSNHRLDGDTLDRCWRGMADPSEQYVTLWDMQTEFLTVQEVAAILKISTDSVIRKFQDRKGVLDLGAPETRFKRWYRVLRIPRETLDKFIVESRVQ